jgi:large subunit ribosomal protein L14
MIQLGSILKVTDKSGVTLVQCIKVLNTRKSRIANIGEMILVTVKRINPRRMLLLK